MVFQEQEARHISSYLDIPNPFLPPPPHHPRIPEPYQTNTHIYKQSMKAPYPKAASAPAQTDIPGTPNKLSLPVGQYDDIRPFLVKRRNKDYNNYKEQVFYSSFDRYEFYSDFQQVDSGGGFGLLIEKGIFRY